MVLVTAVPGCRALFPSDGRRFEARGVPVGAGMPNLPLDTPAARSRKLATAWADGPAVLISVSRSCPVARYRMFDVRWLRQRLADLSVEFGFAVGLTLIYTVEAHPAVDPSPYRADGRAWLTPFNRIEGVRIRSAATPADRRAEAARFAARHAAGFTLLVDGPDDAAWRALGGGPNAAAVVDADGKVRARHGWFDGPAVLRSVRNLIGADGAGLRRARSRRPGRTAGGPFPAGRPAPLRPFRLRAGESPRR